MKTDTQTLIDAVEAGERTDPGGMTTTQDIVDVIPDSYTTVAQELRTLERNGIIESDTFGGDRVWFVTDADDSPDGTTSDRAISTTTRGPVTT